MELLLQSIKDIYAKFYLLYTLSSSMSKDTPMENAQIKKIKTPDKYSRKYSRLSRRVSSRECVYRLALDSHYARILFTLRRKSPVFRNGAPSGPPRNSSGTRSAASNAMHVAGSPKGASLDSRSSTRQKITTRGSPFLAGSFVPGNRRRDEEGVNVPATRTHARTHT